MDERKWFQDGMREFRQGRHAAAIAALSLLLGRGGLAGRLARYYSGMAHRALGLECIRGQGYTQAAWHLRQAVNLIGNRADLGEYLFLAYARGGQHEKCTAEAELLVEAEPGEVGGHVRLALAQWRSGQRPMAIMTLTSAVRQLGDKCELHMALGLLYATMEQYEPARRHLAQAVECDCTSARSLRYLALVDSAQGDFVEAARSFARACALDPRDVMSAYQMCLAAQTAQRQGHTVHLRLPEAARPTAQSVIRQLAEYVAGEPDFIEAILALPPSDADEELMGVAISILRTALTMHPRFADLHCLAAGTLQRLGDLEAARVHARRAVSINGRYVKALLLLAELEAKLGSSAAATECLGKALEAGADYPDVHVRLGDVLRTSGAVAQAREHYSRALRLNGRYERAEQGLRALAA